MELQRAHFWIFLGLGLAVGACLELMKTPSSAPVRLAGFTKFETLLEEGRELKVHEPLLPNILRRKPKPVEEEIVPQQIAQNETPPPTVAVDGPTVVKTPELTPEEKKKKEEEEKKKKEKEKKKKAKERAKKKKEKEDEEERLRLEALERQRLEDLQREEEKKREEEAVAKKAAPMSPPAAMGAPIAPNDTDDPKTVREWEAYLMKEVDYERMARFVRLYQSGIVKADVFYPVIDSMLQDSRPKMRGLALVGLGSTPSSQSFRVLVEVQHNDADIGIRREAGSHVKHYAQIENLKFLGAVITAQGHSDAALEALELIKSSAKANLRNPSTGPNEQGGPGALASTSMARRFTQFLPMLSQTATRANDASVRSAAGQTATVLQALLAPYNLPAPQQPQNQNPPAIAQSN